MDISQFLDLILENANVVHECDHAVGAHMVRVHTGGGKQRSDVQRHRTLRRVQHKKLTPGQPQQGNLVSDGKVGEEWNIPSPFHGGEKQTGCNLAYVLDTNHSVGHVQARLLEAARGVWLGS